MDDSGHDRELPEEDESGGGPGGAEEAAAPQLPAPWEADDYLPADDESGGRVRHDAFIPERRRAFLRRLAITGCILDACRAVGVSSRTIYNLQESDAEFRRHCELAIEIAGSEVALTAWERAVKGVEEPFACGGQVYTRRKYSDSLLRLLLIGSNRKKYGPHPGFGRKRLMKHERKRLEDEIHAEMLAKRRPIEEIRESILRKAEAIERHRAPKKLAAGWTKTEEGYWIPARLGARRRCGRGAGRGRGTPGGGRDPPRFHAKVVKIVKIGPETAEPPSVPVRQRLDDGAGDGEADADHVEAAAALLVADRRRAALAAGPHLGELLAAGPIVPARCRDAGQGRAVALDRLAAAADDDVIAHRRPAGQLCATMSRTCGLLPRRRVGGAHSLRAGRRRPGRGDEQSKAGPPARI